MTDALDDPGRHDTQLVAVFGRAAIGEAARHALLEAGIAAHSVALITSVPLDHLFAPPDEARRLSNALGSGRVIVAVQPATGAEREAAAAVLDRFDPIDLDTQDAGRDEAPVDHTELNHATLSRADMLGKVLPGTPHTVRDMSGQPMTVQGLSEATMVAASTSQERLPVVPPSPPAAIPLPTDASAAGTTTYTYGVPEDVARSMTVEERLRAGQRAKPTRVRYYVARPLPIDRPTS